MNNNISRTLAVALAASALTAGVSTQSAAQRSAGPRWQAWVGCWTAAPAAQTSIDLSVTPVICITPTSQDAVELSTIANGKTVSHDTLDASGREVAIKMKDCAGTQRAQWSADDRRVYVRSTVTCGGIVSNTSSILSMNASGEWIDVRGMRAGEGENVRVAHYREVPLQSDKVTQLPETLQVQLRSAQGARVAAGAPIGTAAVIEATKAADAPVVEAWLLERGQRFSLDAKQLLQLADAGVPGRVTDAMVAVSYPKAFAVARADDRYRDDVVGSRSVVMMPRYDPWSHYGYGYGYGAGYYGYNGYGYGGYGYGSPYGGYYAPIMIVTRKNEVETRGQVVKGRGYTQNSGTSSTPSSSSSGNGSTSSTSGSNSGSTSAPASQPASSGERTAKPRP